MAQNTFDFSYFWGKLSTILAGKQATLTTAQQAAVDSGITSAKVGQYDGYDTSKIGILDILGRGTNIPANTDLNTMTTIGTYYSQDSTRTGTLVNKPFSNSGFNMIVCQTYQGLGGTIGVHQIAYALASGVMTIKMRSYMYSSGSWSWTEWQTLAFTAPA